MPLADTTPVAHRGGRDLPKHSSGHCATHNKQLYASRNVAKTVIKELGSPGMREYRCEARDGYWHVGHLPPAVRIGEKTSSEHYNGAASEEDMDSVYATPPGAEKPLTYSLTPKDFANLPAINGNGRSDAPAKAADNSIESLLLAAEESENESARRLAAKIRSQVNELVDLIRTSTKERELRDLVAERRRLLDEALQELNDLKGRTGYVPKPTAKDEAAAVRGPYAAARQWARENGIEVKANGRVPEQLVEQYLKATGGTR